ncbi:MAG: type II toxin-antitoxin system RelE/ParE family toxin [Clostridia bacterium]|nr:type II toxin-antitoxin system RelE/ParE family toxin [Clostridia bacterium]
MNELIYLPLVLKDLRDIIDYLVNTLKAPKAAADLIDALEKSLVRLQQFPYSCKLYQPQKKLGSEYRVMPVRNFLIFYVATDTCVEIHRVVYGRVNAKNIIK